MINTKLAKAVSMAIAGAALCAGSPSAFASNVMYNTWDAGQLPGCSIAQGCEFAGTPDPDGWITTGGKTTTTTTYQPWYGWDVNSGTLPFGYTGSAALSWAIELTGPGDTGTISANDSEARYGNKDYYVGKADIDTAKGAWIDGAIPETSRTGWRHAIDLGLIKVDNDTVIRLTPTAVDPQYANNFGITVFKGMNETGGWSHHGGWHSRYIPGDTSDYNLRLVTGDTTNYSGLNPTAILLAFAGIDGEQHETPIKFEAFMDGYGQPYVEFTALKDQVYTVIIGGSDNTVRSWGEPVIGYQLDVKAVPVPGAVWLFGSAIAGMIGLGRRKIAIEA